MHVTISVENLLTGPMATISGRDVEETVLNLAFCWFTCVGGVVLLEQTPDFKSSKMPFNRKRKCYLKQKVSV